MAVGGVGGGAAASDTRSVERDEEVREADGPDLAAVETPEVSDAPEVVETREPPSLEVVTDARSVARAEEDAVRGYFERQLELQQPEQPEPVLDPEVPLGQALDGLSYDAANHVTARVAEMAGLERPHAFGTATLMPGPVAERANLGGSLAFELDGARAAGDPEAVEYLEGAIDEIYGENGLAAVDAAIEAARAAGERPEFFASSQSQLAQDPYSAALTESLTPLATESRYRDQVGHEEAAALDAAYANLSPADRAQLDAETRAIIDDRGFLDGAAQALEDTGSDIAATAALGWNLTTDPAARQQFGENVSRIADAIADPERRAEALELIGTELGAGIVDAFTDFPNDPDYYSGYLAGTLMAGGGIAKLTRVSAVAARLGGRELVDGLRRVEVEVDPTVMGSNGGNLRFGLAPRRVGAAPDVDPPLNRLTPQTAVQARIPPGTEFVHRTHSSVDARHAAAELSGLGDDAVNIGSTVRPELGFLGRASPDGLRGWRLDWDADAQEFHVNWWDRTESPGRRDGQRYGRIVIEGGTEADMLDLASHIFDG